MKNFADVFDLGVDLGEIEFISISSLRQIGSLRNIYGLSLDERMKIPDSNVIVIAEKKLRMILGYFQYRSSTDGDNLLASQSFDTFSIQRLELSCLEIVHFEFTDSAWQRLGFRQQLIMGFKELMGQIGSEILIVHYREKMNLSVEALKTFSFPGFRAKYFYCNALSSSSPENLAFESKSESSLFCALAPTLGHLIQAGIGICSDVSFSERYGEVTLLLGFITDRGIQESRLLSSVLNSARRYADASL